MFTILMNLIISTIVTVNCKPIPAGVMDFREGAKRDIECPTNEKDCNVYCMPLRCYNEMVSRDQKKYLESNAPSFVMRHGLHTRIGGYGPMTVHCPLPLSCIGIIKLKATNLPPKSRYPLARSMAILCGDDYLSCHGGRYYFKDAEKAIFRGNAKESIIVFKNVAQVQIEDIDIDRAYASQIPIASKGGFLTLPSQENLNTASIFFMNTVLTDQVDFFQAIARTEHGLSASIFNLGGVVDKVEITCLKEGSCAGSIVLLKQCGGPVTVTCLTGACSFLVIALPLTDDCQDRARRVIDIKVSSAPDHVHSIYVWCPSSKPYYCVRDSDKTEHQKHLISVGIKIFLHLKNLKSHLETDLKGLNAQVPKDRYSVNKDNRRWVLEPQQLSYWGGVSLEAAFGTITVSASGAITGAVAVSAAAGTLGAALTLGFVMPLALPLVIPACVFGGIKFHKYRMQQKEEKEWEFSPGSVIPITAVEDVPMRVSAKQETADIYGINEVDNYFGFDYNVDGFIIEYDYFTGVMLQDQDVRNQVNQQHVNAMNDVFVNVANDQVMVGLVPLCVTLIVSTCVLWVLIFCYGGVCCGFWLNQDDEDIQEKAANCCLPGNEQIEIHF
eukprot:696345_1